MVRCLSKCHESTAESVVARTRCICIDESAAHKWVSIAAAAAAAAAREEVDSYKTVFSCCGTCALFALVTKTEIVF